MIDGFRDAFRLPDLKRRILFVIGALFIYRLGAHIPTPGIDSDAMSQLFAQGGVLGFLDLFAGGALRRFSIFALGVAPYINSTSDIFPALEKMQKEGEEGRKKITQYTRYGTIFFALVQAVGMTTWLRNLGIFSGGLMPMVIVVATVTTGSVVVTTSGNEKGEFMPNGGMTRAMFTQVLANIEQAPLSANKTSRYTDVAEDAWY